jgi:hypothetical protein
MLFFKVFITDYRKIYTIIWDILVKIKINTLEKLKKDLLKRDKEKFSKGFYILG